MIREKVLKTIKQHNMIEDNQHIVIGLSGGPDSVCLFHILVELASEKNLHLYPVHINHKFRPGAAEEDQAYVEKICKDAGYPCQSFVFDCNQISKDMKITSEEAGRLVRYKSFAEVAEKIKNNGISSNNIKIAVAQNADDQAETILFRILRGAGTDGLSGISYKRFDEFGNEIIRPILDIPKQDILKYCQENQLNPRIDGTNLQPIYTRNKIRINLIPYLETEFNINIKETLIRLGKIADTDKICLWNMATELYNEVLIFESDEEIVLDGMKLRDTHKALRQRVISLALKKIGLEEDVSFTHFEGAESIIFNDKPSASLDVPKGYTITKVYNNVKIFKPNNKEKKTNFKISHMTMGEYNQKSQSKESQEPKTQISKGSYFDPKPAVFDYDKMQAQFGEDFEDRMIIRTRDKGDFLPLGEGKNKKLQDLLVDAKIPKTERDKVKFVAIGHEILWIFPYSHEHGFEADMDKAREESHKTTGLKRGRYSLNYRLSPATKNVICIEIN